MGEALFRSLAEHGGAFSDHRLGQGSGVAGAGHAGVQMDLLVAGKHGLRGELAGLGHALAAGSARQQ